MSTTEERNNNKDNEMVQSAFQDKLTQLRANNCEELPTPELAILTRTITRLRRDKMHTRCLQVGETVPDFEFIDANNVHRKLYEVLESGPVILNFFRGLWCPYCETQIEAYENIQAELTRLGCAYFAISPQQPQTAGERSESYQVIFDRDNKIARDFGIVYGLEQVERNLFESWGLMLDKVNGSDGRELPVPATFIVCKDRTIGYEYVDVDFRARCCPEQLIEELKSFCDCR
ncbi:MAG: peroxiredoxin-like family protein [Pseudomonadales bacterium]